MAERLNIKNIVGTAFLVPGVIAALYGAWGMSFEGHYTDLIESDYTDPSGRVYDTHSGEAYTKDTLQKAIDYNRVVTASGLVSSVIGAIVLTRKSQTGRVKGALSVASV